MIKRLTLTIVLSALALVAFAAPAGAAPANPKAEPSTYTWRGDGGVKLIAFIDRSPAAVNAGTPYAVDVYKNGKDYTVVRGAAIDGLDANLFAQFGYHLTPEARAFLQSQVV